MKAETDRGMKPYVIERDGERSLRVLGQHIGEGSSHTHDCGGRWTEIDIYRTQKGKYVVAVVGWTQWQGENNRHSATVADTEEGVVDALIDGNDGYLSAPAKVALDDAGIDYAEVVE